VLKKAASWGVFSGFATQHLARPFEGRELWRDMGVSNFCWSRGAQAEKAVVVVRRLIGPRRDVPPLPSNRGGWSTIQRRDSGKTCGAHSGQPAKETAPARCIVPLSAATNDSSGMLTAGQVAHNLSAGRAARALSNLESKKPDFTKASPNPAPPLNQLNNTTTINK
jgi:hypothetical protein